MLFTYWADRHFESTSDSRIDLRSSAMVEAQHPAEPIGYVPPVEYEAMYYQQQMAPAMVAGVK